MDTAFLNLTRRVREVTAGSDLGQRETRVAGRCVIPGCKYSAPLGKYCGLHAGRELASRRATADYARKF